MATVRSSQSLVADVLARHPDWCRTATVQMPDGGTVRLIYVQASSSVVCYNPSTQQTHFVPLDAEIVKNAEWVKPDAEGKSSFSAERITTPSPQHQASE